jgi:hypothetical protein
MGNRWKREGDQLSNGRVHGQVSGAAGCKSPPAIRVGEDVRQ